MTCIETHDEKTLLLDGRWQGAAQTMPVVNPYNGDLLATVACAQTEHVTAAIDSAINGFARNRDCSTRSRSELLRKVSQWVDSRSEEFAQCICRFFRVSYG